MAGLGNKKSEVAKVLYFLNFRINIKIVSEEDEADIEQVI